MRLSADTREELVTQLLQTRRAMGWENEWFLHGFPTLKGLYQMTDEELLEEYEQAVDDSDELLLKAQIELRILAEE